MNNEPVAYGMFVDGDFWDAIHADEYKRVEGKYDIPLYTHPVKDREKDRLRFSDEAFNRWLDESISDSGHTVYDLVENVCEAWRGWENSQYYIHPVKELTEQAEKDIRHAISCYFDDSTIYGYELSNRIIAILRKAQEK